MTPTQQITVDEFIKRSRAELAWIERHREAIARGEVILDNEGTLRTKDAWARYVLSFQQPEKP